MKNNQWKQRLITFMSGRYGSDTLNRTLWITGLIIILLAAFLPDVPALIGELLGLALLVWGYYRMFSRNISKRYSENQRFLQWVRTYCQQPWARLRGSRQFRYFACPQCHTKVRVPRGKGKVRIRCPKCGEAFEKKA